MVCINAFHTDTKAEIAMVKKAAEAAGARCAVSSHWANGGDGALELADAVMDACNEKNEFKFLYPLEMKLATGWRKLPKWSTAPMVYPGHPRPKTKAKMLESDPQYNDYMTMMVKTHLSLTHDPGIKGCTQGLDTAYPRCPDLFRRQIPLPRGRDYQPDARHQLRPGLQKSGR